ncbi:LmeA family phospholipid-binding protein [Rhodococcus ruber]|uniref:LmeA family phospholipid-binding protein n=1 Tax=Rhodococcus ruber TaxID=1830 RepID=UPI003D8185D8
MTNRKRVPFATIGIVLAVALVAVLVGAEVYVRNRATNCLAQSFESELGTNVDVDLGWKPVLLSLVDKQVSSVTLDSDDTAFGPAQEMQVHAVVRDVDLRESAAGAGTIGISSAEVVWPSSGILATVQTLPLGSLITDVTPDADAGTLRFTVGGAGLAELTVRPEARNGAIAIETVDASLFGIGLPTALVDGIVQILTESLQQYPLDMQATSVSVTDSGIEVTLEGGAYTMPEPPAGQQSQNQLDC